MCQVAVNAGSAVAADTNQATEVKLLTEIRDEIRGIRADNRKRHEHHMKHKHKKGRKQAEKRKQQKQNNKQDDKQSGVAKQAVDVDLGGAGLEV